MRPKAKDTNSNPSPSINTPQPEFWLLHHLPLPQTLSLLPSVEGKGVTQNEPISLNPLNLRTTSSPGVSENSPSSPSEKRKELDGAAFHGDGVQEPGAASVQSDVGESLIMAINQ